MPILETISEILHYILARREKHKEREREEKKKKTGQEEVFRFNKCVSF